MALIRKKSGGGGANWMDTYGDMVTLLLCFFVLLYSMSTISEANWKAIVQSFNPSAVETPTATTGSEGPVADPDEAGLGLEQGMTEETMTQEDVETALEQLYQAIKEYAEQSDSAQNIEVTKGDGYVFVSFNDAVFFDGESYTLRAEGKKILDVMAGVLDNAKEYIDEVRVMGHTAQAKADQANRPERDRFLSSNRATVATVYLQEHCGLSPARLVSVGYGQWRPVDSNETAQTRAHNRRVEMLITGLDLLDEIGDSIRHYESMREGGAGATAS